jgi:hypothetical protein
MSAPTAGPVTLSRWHRLVSRVAPVKSRAGGMPATGMDDLASPGEERTVGFVVVDHEQRDGEGFRGGLEMRGVGFGRRDVAETEDVAQRVAEVVADSYPYQDASRGSKAVGIPPGFGVRQPSSPLALWNVALRPPTARYPFR